MLNGLAKAGSFFVRACRMRCGCPQGFADVWGVHVANICLSLKTKLSNFQHRFVPIPKY